MAARGVTGLSTSLPDQFAPKQAILHRVEVNDILADAHAGSEIDAVREGVCRAAIERRLPLHGGDVRSRDERCNGRIGCDGLGRIAGNPLIKRSRGESNRSHLRGIEPEFLRKVVSGSGGNARR